MKSKSSIRVTHNEACTLQNEVFNDSISKLYEEFFLFSIASSNGIGCTGKFK